MDIKKDIKVYLAYIKKEVNVDKISIEFLEEEKYKKGTNLDIENLTTFTYYNIDGKYYNLAFEVNPKIAPNIELAYIKEGNEIKKLNLIDGKYFIEKREREDKEIRKDFATIGYETLVIIDKKENKIIHEINIKINSTTMYEEEYIKIINDLIKINKNIIYQRDKKVYIGEQNIDTPKEQYLKEAQNIYLLSKRVLNNPRKSLSMEKYYKNKNNIKKVGPKLIIEKAIKPYKTKYLIQQGKEDINIYENRMIKYSLEKILITLERYKNDDNDAYEEIKETIKKYEKKLTLKDVKSYEIMKECIGNGQKDEYYDQKDKFLIDTFTIFLRTSGENIPTEEEKESYLKLNYDKSNHMFNLFIDRNFEKEEINTKNLYCFCKEDGSTKNISEIYYKKDNEYKKTHTKFFRFSYKNKNLENIKNIYEILMNNDNSIIEFNVNSTLEIEKKGNYKDITFNFKKINYVKINGKKINLTEGNKDLKNYNSFFAKFDETILPIEFINYFEEEKIALQEKKDIIENRKIDKLIDDINKLLYSDEIKKIKTKEEILKNTQIFNSDPNYNKLFRRIKKLNIETQFLSDISAKKYFLKTAPDIYEFWCYYKMIYTLIYEMGWKMCKNLDIAKEIANVLENKISEDNGKREILLYHGINDDDYIYLRLSYERRVYKKEEYRKNKNKEEYFKPDYQIEISNSCKEVLGTFYIDAKFKNYKEMQGEFNKDIEEVSIEKYYQKINDKYVKASFIVHPMNNDRYITYGGKNLFRYEEEFNNKRGCYENKAKFIIYDESIEKKKYDNYNAVDHRFGSFCLTPHNTNYFKTFMKMILEYHLSYYWICWNCGEIHVQSKKLLTAGNNTKYHFRCNSCGEFWVKSHCSKNGHNIIKHIDNYHSLLTNEWYLLCPKCFDGFISEDKNIENKDMSYRNTEITFNPTILD